MLTSVLLILAAAPAAGPVVVPAVATVEPDAMHMSANEIRAFNATVPLDHPFHIRCRREAKIGSLVDTVRSCRTNRQWAKADQVGNQEARDVMERTTSKFTPTN